MSRRPNQFLLQVLLLHRPGHLFFISIVSQLQRTRGKLSYIVPTEPLNREADWSCRTCGNLFSAAEIISIDEKVCSCMYSMLLYLIYINVQGTKEKQLVETCGTSCELIDKIYELEDKFGPSYHLVVKMKMHFFCLTEHELRINNAVLRKWAHDVLLTLQRVEHGRSALFYNATQNISRWMKNQNQHEIAKLS
jgi:hypothetical protein